MIRFIIKRRILSRGTGLESSSFETVDCHAPDLEQTLMGGGHDEAGAYDYRELVGVEVLPQSAPKDGPDFAAVISMLEGYKCLVKATGQFAEHHYLPEVEFQIESLMPLLQGAKT